MYVYYMYVYVLSMTYLLYYRARLDELKIFLETEAWELCPVRSTFSLHQLRVYTTVHVPVALLPNQENFCFIVVHVQVYMHLDW